MCASAFIVGISLRDCIFINVNTFLFGKSKVSTRKQKVLNISWSVSHVWYTSKVGAEVML